MSNEQIVKYCATREDCRALEQQQFSPLILWIRKLEPREFKCFVHGHALGSLSRSHSFTLLVIQKMFECAFVSDFFHALGRVGIYRVVYVSVDSTEPENYLVCMF